jgi:tRNA-2-methylthio-N6-dimethylallyladenosine synthase
MDDELIAAHAALPALMPYVHLPVQSGSDRILDAMNRKHTAAHYLDIVAKMRAARADLAFTSDFIVGFPGETEEDFQDTLKLVETVGFAGAYTFAYSVRPGTPAAEMEAQVPEDVKTDRLHRLQALIAGQQRAFNASFVGKTLDVLLEKPGRLSGQLVGKSPYLQTVQVMAPPELIGSIVPLAIVDIGTNTLFGALADQPATPVFAAAGA